MSQPERAPDRYYPRVFMEFDLSAAFTHALRPLLDRNYVDDAAQLKARSPVFMPKRGVESDEDLQEVVYENIHGDFRRLGARFDMHEADPRIVRARSREPEASFCQHALICIGLERRRQYELQAIMAPPGVALVPERPVHLAVGIPAARLKSGLTEDEYVARVKEIDRDVQAELRKGTPSQLYVYGQPRIRLRTHAS